MLPRGYRFCFVEVPETTATVIYMYFIIRVTLHLHARHRRL